MHTSGKVQMKRMANKCQNQDNIGNSSKEETEVDWTVFNISSTQLSFYVKTLLNLAIL